MSLKDFYYKLEDKYFSFLDKLEKKGLPVYKLIDPLEKKGIPTFAIFNLIIFAIIILLIVSIVGPVELTPQSELTLSFLDDTGNGLANQTIDLNFSGLEKTITTDDLGITIVKGLDTSEQYELTLDDLKYSLDSPITIDLSNKQVYTLTLTQAKELISKTIEFKHKSSGELITDDLTVSFTCSDNIDYEENVTVTDGSYNLDNVPVDCGVLIPNILDYDEIDSDYLDTEDEETAEVFLSPVTSEGAGEISITILDKETSLPVSGIEVAIRNSYGTVENSGTTGENGLVIFSSVNAGDYYICTYDSSGTYGEITSEDQIVKTVYANQTSEITVELNKDIVGRISLNITDIETSEPIPDVTVSLLKGQDVVSSQTSDLDGLIVFNVKENINYNLSFDHPSYIRYSKSLRISDSIQNIKLKRVNQDTLRAVYVSVIDTEKQPVSFANLKLWDTETNTIIKTLITDIKGQAIVSNLDQEKTYKIEAVVGKYSKTTLPFSVTERERYDETIIMEIGEGTYNLHIVDSSGTPISTAVTVYDTLNNIEIQSKRTNTDTEGNTLMRIRSDKTVYFVIDNYESKYITVKYNLDADNSKKIDIQLPRVTSSSNIEYEGLFNSQGEVITSITPGQTVKAKFLLNVNNNYSKAIAHIRTGKGDSCDGISHILEEDDIYIKEVRFAGRKIIGSTSYTPCRGEHKDLSSLTKRDGKWFNVILDTPLQGTYLIEADVVILDSAIGTLPLYYRAEFHQGNAVLRKPIDTKLATSLETSEKQGLYAYAKEATLYTGASNFCNSSLCYNFSIFNKSKNITKNIIDKYTAKVNTSYKMFFNINIGNRPIPNTTLNITGTGSSIKLDRYIIDGVGAQILSGEDLDSIELGNLGSNDHISGEVEFNIIDDKSDTFNFNIISNGENVFSKNILIDITPSNTINLEIVPRIFLPFVSNNIVILITDDENKSIVGADVTAKLNTQTITVGKTNQEGMFGFVLPGPNLGDVLKLTINKEGYKKIINDYKIDNKLISTMPETIEVNLDLSKGYLYNKSVTLQNNTALPLAIKSIKQNINSKFISLKTNTEEQLINPGEKIKLNLDTLLTEEGLDLIQQKEISGDIILVVNNADVAKSWTVKIPITIRITFGDSLDKLDCLKIKPNKLEIKTEPEQEVEYKLKLINECTIHNSPVSLGKIVAEVNWENYKELGLFSIYINDKEYILKEDEEIPIIKNFAANKKKEFKLVFKTKKVKSTISEPKIIFRSIKPTTSGADKIESKLSTKIIVNKYSECLEFKPKEIVQVLACNMNSGMNFYGMQGAGYGGMTLGAQMGMPGYNQGYMSSSYGYSPTNYQNQYENGGTNAYTNNYMSSTYAQPNMLSLYNARFGQDFLNMLDYPVGMTQGMGFSNRMGCPEQMLTVTNKCVAGVDLKFDAEQGINITSPSEFSLDKGESGKIKLIGGYMMDIFKLSAYAKGSDDVDEDYKLVKDIPVKVTLPMQDIPQQCIHISTDKLNFSSFKSNYKTLDIINTCVDYGFRLANVKIKDFNSLRYGNILFLSITKSLGEIEPVNKTTGQTEDGKNVEIWTIKLKRNPEIREVAIEQYREEFGATSNAGKMTMIRNLNSFFGNAVNLSTIISVGVRTPNLRQKSMYKDFPITLVDNFQWLMFTGAFKPSGDDTPGEDTPEPKPGFQSPDSSQAPRLPTTDADIPQNIITDVSGDNQDIVQVKLNGSKKNSVIIQIADEYLEADKFTEVNGYGKKCFSGKISSFNVLDKITDKSYIKNEQKAYFYKGDVLVDISFSQKDKSYLLCFSRPLRVLTVDEFKINNYFRKDFDVYNSETFILNFLNKDKHIYNDLSIAVVGNLERESLVGELKSDLKYDNSGFDLKPGECLDPYGFKKQGITGLANYKLYGFDRLLFKWDIKNIDETTCDIGNYYCDQTQFYYYLNKKAQKLYDTTTGRIKSSSDEFKQLGDIYFLLDSEKNIKRIDKKIKIKDISEVVKNKFKELDPKNLDNYLKLTNTIISENIPDGLKELTIIKVSTKVEDSEITQENFKKFINTVFTNNTYENGDYISITAKEYSKNMASYETLKKKVSSLDIMKKDGSFDEVKLNPYLKVFLENMEIYYGVSLNKFIVNIKPFGDLTSENNKLMMFTKTVLTSNMLNVALDSSSLTNITDPKAYLVNINVTKDASDNKNKLYVNISSLDDILEDEMETNEYYQKNILFYTSINPTHYTYNKIPFILGNQGNSEVSGVSEDSYAKNYTDYTSWKEIQDGYIFSVSSNNGGMKIIKYADIRPMKVITQGDELLYKLSHSTSTIKEPHNWLVGDIISGGKKVDTFNSSKGYNYLNLTEINPLRTTFFVFANDKSLRQGNNYQLDISSKTQMQFISGIVTDPIDYDNKTFIYKYHVPKDIQSAFSGLDYSTIESILNQVKESNVCFESNSGKLLFWTNPSYKGNIEDITGDDFEVRESLSDLKDSLLNEVTGYQANYLTPYYSILQTSINAIIANDSLEGGKLNTKFSKLQDNITSDRETLQKKINKMKLNDETKIREKIEKFKTDCEEKLDKIKAEIKSKNINIKITDISKYELEQQKSNLLNTLRIAESTIVNNGNTLKTNIDAVNLIGLTTDKVIINSALTEVLSEAKQEKDELNRDIKEITINTGSKLFSTTEPITREVKNVNKFREEYNKKLDKLSIQIEAFESLQEKKQDLLDTLDSKNNSIKTTISATDLAIIPLSNLDNKEEILLELNTLKTNLDNDHTSLSSEIKSDSFENKINNFKDTKVKSHYKELNKKIEKLYEKKEAELSKITKEVTSQEFKDSLEKITKKEFASDLENWYKLSSREYLKSKKDVDDAIILLSLINDGTLNSSDKMTIENKFETVKSNIETNYLTEKNNVNSLTFDKIGAVRNSISKFEIDSIKSLREVKRNADLIYELSIRKKEMLDILMLEKTELNTKLDAINNSSANVNSAILKIKNNIDKEETRIEKDILDLKSSELNFDRKIQNKLITLKFGEINNFKMDYTKQINEVLKKIKTQNEINELLAQSKFNLKSVLDKYYNASTSNLGEINVYIENIDSYLSSVSSNLSSADLAKINTEITKTKSEITIKYNNLKQSISSFNKYDDSKFDEINANIKEFNIDSFDALKTIEKHISLANNLAKEKVRLKEEVTTESESLKKFSAVIKTSISDITDPFKATELAKIQAIDDDIYTLVSGINAKIFNLNSSDITGINFDKKIQKQKLKEIHKELYSFVNNTDDKLAVIIKEIKAKKATQI